MFGLRQAASAEMIYNVTLDTTPLVGHPAGPFVVFLAFTDGSGIGDANNTVTVSDLSFGGGAALADPITFGSVSGSLEGGLTITDASAVNFFEEGFNPGLQLSFSLDLTSNDDEGGIPDRLTFFILDSLGLPLPTLAPAGDYFFGVDLGSTGPVFDAWGSDFSRSPSLGSPVTISAPIIASPVPEPSTIWLLNAMVIALAAVRCFARRNRRNQMNYHPDPKEICLASPRSATFSPLGNIHRPSQYR
jgi:hypothetical protein